MALKVLTLSTTNSVKGTSVFLAASLHVLHTRARMISFGGRKLKMIATSSAPTSSAVPSMVRCMISLFSVGDGGDEFIARGVYTCQEE